MATDTVDYLAVYMLSGCVESVDCMLGYWLIGMSVKCVVSSGTTFPDRLLMLYLVINELLITMVRTGPMLPVFP